MLRRRDTGESDRRLTLLTRNEGRMDVIAKGARKAASRLAGVSDPLTVSQMSLAGGRRTAYLTQAQTLQSFRGLRQDFDRLSFGLSLAELVGAVSPLDQPVPEMYELLLQALGLLEIHPKPLVVLVWAQMQALARSGFVPNFQECVVSGEPITVADPFVSPHAGGFLSDGHAARFTDRFRVRAEVLYGLTRIGELDLPPANLKFARESVATLIPFWRAIADYPIPATEALAPILAELEPLSENK